MYYLLGYKLFGQEQKFIQDMLARENMADFSQEGGSNESTSGHSSSNRHISWAERALRKKGMMGRYGNSEIFDTMEENFLQQVISNVIYKHIYSYIHVLYTCIWA